MTFQRVRSAGARALGDDGILHGDPTALPATAALLLIVLVRAAAGLAVPAQQGLGDGAAGLTRHAGRDGAGPAVPAPSLPQPARPEPHAQVLPGESHGAVGEAPHQLLKAPPLLLAPLQPDPRPVRQAERPQVLEEVGPGLVRPPTAEPVHKAVVVSVRGLVHREEFLIQLTAQASPERLGVEVFRGGVQGLIWVLQEILDGKLIRRRRPGSFRQGGGGGSRGAVVIRVL